MFKNPFQVAVVFALIGLLAKLSIFYIGIQHHDVNYITFVYMLLIMFAIFFGIRSEKIAAKGTTTFGQDFRSGARTASFFAIIIGVITYIYYTQIDPGFFPFKIDSKLALEFKNVNTLIDEKGLEETKNIYKNNIVNLKVIYSALSQTTYTLFGLVFYGLMHSAVFALLMKKYPGFKK